MGAPRIGCPRHWFGGRAPSRSRKVLEAGPIPQASQRISKRETNTMRLPRLLEAFGILAVACLVSQACTPARPVKSLKTAPDFALNDSEGVRIRLSDYKGKVVLLNFWATFCHGCVLEIPWSLNFKKDTRTAGSPSSAFRSTKAGIQ